MPFLRSNLLTASCHERFMRKAILLAQRATRLVTPNPRVGAVVVKDSVIIGEGYHKQAGCPHAEVEALRQASEKARGAVLYVTLEPCCTAGKTPPCTQAVIDAGISEVYVGVIDPNPLHAGNGIEILRRNGISVHSGMLEKECRNLIEDFSKYITLRKPFVIVKTAMSIDGKIATSRGESKWITSAKSRIMVQKIRRSVDAIMVGVGTVIADNPHLTIRNASRKYPQPWRIIIDPELSIPDESNVLTDSFRERTVIITTPNSSLEKKERLSNANVRIIELDKSGMWYNPNIILSALADLPVVSVLLEGGSQAIGTFFDAECIDKCYFFTAPKIIGGSSAPTPVGGSGISSLDSIVALRDIQWKKCGKDMMLSGYPIWNKQEI
ncbi:MAG: bifunctional diaminohydroxyphosphoribosylaminopyrimidine deaminase/5-amino-6-(5-phosphoribosylamino)uracil reductase RibD [Candidatus Auribacterota bacterium]